MNKPRNRRLYLVDYLIMPDTKVDNGAVLCENDTILAVGGISAFALENGIEIRRFENAYLTPGFIDTHIHGAGGFDSSGVDASPNPISEMSRILASRGVTGFFPTVVADERELMLKNLARLAEVMDTPLPGATADGINVEGPFINPCKSGAQKDDAIIPIDLGFAKELIAAGGGKVKVMTFAPELKNATALIELLTEHGVKPSMGHSLATGDEALRAIDAGASHCTHLFNGMVPLHQRDLGLASVVLTDSRVSAELIIDGRHIHPRMVDLACRCKKRGRIVGISDCTMAAGMPDGTYRIGPSSIVVRNGYSQTEAGTLAGTTTMLDTGWHSLMGCGHLPDTSAARAVTRNAADSYQLERRGQLAPRYRADLAVFEKETNRPLMTVRAGEIVYQAEG